MWKRGELDAIQLPIDVQIRKRKWTIEPPCFQAFALRHSPDSNLNIYSGTVVIKQVVQKKYEVALYARVSSADQKADCDRQMARLREYAAARGYQVQPPKMS